MLNTTRKATSGQIVRVKQRLLSVYDKQAEFLRSPSWVRGFCAGRGAGKTKIGALAIICEANNGEPFMAASPTYNDIVETTLPVFIETAKECGAFIRSVMTPVPKVEFKTRDGGRAAITFRSADNPDRFHGPSRAALWLDEASLMPEDAYIFGAAILRFRGRMGRLLLTFTPRGKKHWTYKIFYEQDGATKENTQLIRAASYDNPFLPEQYAELLASQYTKAMREQYLAGEFIDLDGVMFQREWFQIAGETPRRADRVRYWDKAASVSKSASHTAGVLVARTPDGRYFVEDVVRGQWSVYERDQIILQTAQIDAHKYDNSVVIYTEQEPGSGGKESAQSTIRMLAGFPVHREIVGGQQSRKLAGEEVAGSGKVVRAMPFAAQAEGMNVWLKAAEWNTDYIDELVAFPNYKENDQVDATSGAFNALARSPALAWQEPASKHTEPQPRKISRSGVQLDRGDQPQKAGRHRIERHDRR